MTPTPHVTKNNGVWEARIEGLGYISATSLVELKKQLPLLRKQYAHQHAFIHQDIIPPKAVPEFLRLRELAQEADAKVKALNPQEYHKRASEYDALEDAAEAAWKLVYAKAGSQANYNNWQWQQYDKQRFKPKKEMT